MPLDQNIKSQEKICQRCHQAFECNAENILECQCFGIELKDSEKKYVEANYNDCLCANCLRSLDIKS